MENFDFTGIDAASGTSMTMPGTRGIFAISNIEFGVAENENATPHMKLTFSAKKILDETGKWVVEESSFSHRFHMTAKAMGRVQYFAEVVLGQKFSGQITGAALTQAFINKDVALKVVGQVSQKGKGYADLGYAGFAKKPAEFEANPAILNFSASERALIADAVEAIHASRSGNADTEAVGAGAPAALPAGSNKKPF